MSAACGAIRLTHMHHTVKSQQGSHRREQADHHRRPSTAPIPSIAEFKKHSLGTTARRRDPQRNDSGEKAHNINDQDQILNQRQLLCQKGIEKHRECDDSNHEKGSVPTFKDVIW